jgi:hypothetical protein
VRARSRGAALVMSLLLLALLTMFALAAASSARIERALASNELFRENAANAARAGIELAMLELLSTASPDLAPSLQRRVTLGEGAGFEVRARFAGYETNLPQESAVLLVGAHFEITSSGRSGRGAFEALSSGLMIVVPAPASLVESLADTPGRGAAACGIVAGSRCFRSGDSLTTFRHRTPASDASS